MKYYVHRSKVHRGALRKLVRVGEAPTRTLIHARISGKTALTRGLTVDVQSPDQGTVIGLISDTHGLLRPEALAALHNVDLIIHAGDAGRDSVLEMLGRLAPVCAVRGNVDRGMWAERLPRSQRVEIGEISLYVHHGHEELDLGPAAAGCRVVVRGHSHKPESEAREGVLHLNPGSAGPRRFKLPVTLMRLYIDGKDVRYELVELV